MYLTKEEERMLRGEMGYAAQISMEILVALGEIYGAERMIPVTSAQISGVSYKNLGEAGLEWLEEISQDGRVRAPSTLNPGGVDLERWREMGVSPSFVDMQRRVINAYVAMGVQPTLTCTPYLAGNSPGKGEHIAWSESSAVVYANSVLGARTNREGGPGALASALTGRTPYYGLHIVENRAYSLKVKVPELRDELDFALLGYVVGKISRERIPMFVGVRSADHSELKALGAALASAGSTPMFHVEGITPEHHLPPLDKVELVEIEKRELREAEEEFREDVDADLVFVGCPHASLEELIMLVERLDGRPVRKRVWACTSRAVRDVAARIGVLGKLERLGVLVLSDTCPVVAPVSELKIRSIATNSVKCAWYSRNLNNMRVRVCGLGELVEEAVTGWR